MAKHNQKTILKNTLTLFISVIVSFLILEVGVRVFIPQDKMITWIEMHERGFVMNQSGGIAFHEFENRRVTYRFTSHRTRGNTQLSQDTLTTPILVVGDSYTFGLLLDEKDTFVSHIQHWADTSYANDIQFHNAAVGGAGMADWPAWIENFGKDISPSKVIYFMNNQDVIRALSKNLFVLSDSTNHTLMSSQRWAPRSMFKNLSSRGWYRSLQAHSHLMNVFVKLLWKHAYFKDVTHNFSLENSTVPIPNHSQFNIESSYSFNLSIALLHRMQDWCKRNNCELILTNTGYFDPSHTDSHTLRLHNYLSNTNDFNYIDLYPCVSKSVNGNFSTIQIENDGHPNEQGADLIATCFINKLPSLLDLP